MLKRLLIIAVIAIPSWYFTDMDSPSRFYAYVLPIVTFGCFMALCLLIIAFFAQLGEQQNLRDK